MAERAAAAPLDVTVIDHGQRRRERHDIGRIARDLWRQHDQCQREYCSGRRVGLIKSVLGTVTNATHRGTDSGLIGTNGLLGSSGLFSNGLLGGLSINGNVSANSSANNN